MASVANTYIPLSSEASLGLLGCVPSPGVIAAAARVEKPFRRTFFSRCCLQLLLELLADILGGPLRRTQVGRRHWPVRTQSW
jgi:hypothetical protein